MSNVMSLRKLINHTSRSGFDLTQKIAFTAAVGEILPISCQEVLPGDVWRRDLSWLSRTRPVNTAAYTRFREYFDVVFVPTNQLCNTFDDFVMQLDGQVPHAASIRGNSNFGDTTPYFTCQDLAKYVHSMSFDGTTASVRKNVFGFDRARLTCKILEYLGYGNYYPYLEREYTWEKHPMTNLRLNPFKLLAYQKACADIFRFSQWEKLAAYRFNVDYLTQTAISSPDMHIPVSTLTGSGAPAFDTMMDLNYCNFNKDYFMGLLPEAQFGDGAVVPLHVEATDRITDGGHYLETWSSDAFSNKSALYKNSVSGGPSKILYKLGNDQNKTADLSLPSTLVNKINSQIKDLPILALRQAEALQRWKEIQQSGSQDYRDMLSKHWGVSLPAIASDRVQYVGGFDGNLDISEVVNQNLTGAEGADIQGKGIGGSRGGHFVNFKAQQHGYIVVLYHAVPLLDYAIDGISKDNTKTLATDFAIPEFDKIGMQKTHLFELDNSPEVKAAISSMTNEDAINMTLGFAPRYAEYKTNYDRIVGGFKHDPTLGTWVAPITAEYIRKYLLARFALGTQNSIFTKDIFKVCPNIVDSIFVGEGYNGTLASDQLLVNCNIDDKAVRNLDYDGLPY